MNLAALESPQIVDSNTPLTFCSGTKILASMVVQLWLPKYSPPKSSKKQVLSCIQYSIAANGATNAPSAPIKASLSVD